MQVLTRTKDTGLQKNRKNGNRSIINPLTKKAEEVLQLLHEAQFDTGQTTDSVALVKNDRR